VDDDLEFLFRLSKEIEGDPYRLSVGDTFRLESVTVPTLNRELRVDPDGAITVPIIGRVPAAGRSVQELREDLERRSTESIRDTTLQITPVVLFTPLEEFQSSISGYGQRGEISFRARVSPDGMVQLPAVHQLPVAGLTLAEIEREATARYAEVLQGVHVTVLLRSRAPAQISILGEVRQPGRYAISQPLSVSNAISLANGWINGADLKRVIVFRRDAEWRLIATSLDLRDSLNGESLENRREIWLRDGDTVLVPKSRLRRIDDAIQLVFTNGLYRLLPFDASVGYAKISGPSQDAGAVVPSSSAPQ
jgi:polysaccharide export outer membrane protein